MALTIRLTRVGKKSEPKYRIIVTEIRSKNKGSFIEILGSLNPLENPPKIDIDKNRLKYWVSKGAKLSNSLEHYLK